MVLVSGEDGSNIGTVCNLIPTSFFRRDLCQQKQKKRILAVNRFGVLEHTNRLISSSAPSYTRIFFTFRKILILRRLKRVRGISEHYFEWTRNSTVSGKCEWRLPRKRKKVLCFPGHEKLTATPSKLSRTSFNHFVVVSVPNLLFSKIV